MKNHFYFEASRRTIIQFLNLFNDIKIARYDDTGKLLKYVSVPLKFAPKSKAWWWEEKFNNTTGKTIRNVILPHIACQMTGIELANDRLVNKHHKLRSERVLKLPVKHKRFENPVPYNFNFEVKLAAQYMIDISQILEQILPFFDPTAYIRITIPELNIDHKEEIIDEGAYPMDLKVVYDGGSWEANVDGGSDEYRVILWTLNFKVEGYLFKPDIEDPIIEHALINYYDYENYQVYGEEHPLVETTSNGLSAEKWPIPTLSGDLSGALYSESAKLWYTYEREGD